MSALLTQRVALKAQRCAHEPAVVGVRAAGVCVWDWQQLWEESGRAAALLLRLGVQPGEAVAYQLANGPEFLVLTLGALRIGAVCCPLMPIFREHELRYILAQARARVLVTMLHFHGRDPASEAAAIAAQLPLLRHVLVMRDPLQDAAAALTGSVGVDWDWLDAALVRTRPDAAALAARTPLPDAPAQLLFTSGTTGAPKGVVHRQDVLLRATAMEAQQLALGGTDCIYVPSPLAHQTGFLYGMWLALSLGARQIVQEHWDAAQGLAALREWGGTFVQAATPFLMDLAEAVERGAPPPAALRVFVATGAAVPRAFARRAAQLLGTQVCGAFGTTEGCLATLASPTDPPEKTWGTDGRALPGVQIRVCDEDGTVLPAGQEGLYQTRSPTMFTGYLDAPGATAAAYTADGWYRTGDLAVIDADGYLRVTGRVKDIINRGGEKIPVAQIEQLLYQHDAVKEIAIVAMPDRRLVERACAFVVLQPGRTLDFGAMQAFLDQHRVAKQYWPERLELVGELPRTPSGKIQKYALRERARAFATADRTGTHA